MIRRHYVLPVRADADPTTVDEMLEVLRAADRFIPGLLDSSAALADDGSTVIWENSFVDEAAYTGPYMVHPYHVGAIDDFLMPDSPTALVFRSHAVRFSRPDEVPTLRAGIRRLVLLGLEDDQLATIAALAADATDMTTSFFGADDVGWVSGKGRTFSHIWEQGFADREQLDRHLRSPTGSTPEQLVSAGIDADAIEVFTCPFSLRPTEDQNPPPMPVDDGPIHYSLTHRVDPDDADTLAAMLDELYDPFMADNGVVLVNRSRTVEGGYRMVEIDSTWEIESLAAYGAMRSGLVTAAGWGLFVRDSIPLVRGGRRRFHRPRQ
ncbi:MAG: hypothetical protein AAGE98_10350 [Actinomycetota bacterium]